MKRPVYLYVTPFFPSLGEWRGAYCLDFVKALIHNASYEVKVFVPGKGPDYEIEGVRVHRFVERNLPSGLLPFLFRGRNERSFLAAVGRSGVCLEDVAVCHGHTARFSIYPLAVKTINPSCLTLLHHHSLCSFGLNVGIFHKSFFYNSWLFCRFRDLFERLDCHVFISNAARESFLRAPDSTWSVYKDYHSQMRGPRLMRCRPVRVNSSLILHNGVDEDVFGVAPLSVKRIAEPPTIGCVGNVDSLKDQMTLILAVLRIKTFGMMSPVPRVRIVGSGPMLGHCRGLVQQKQLEQDVSFETEMSHEQLADFYRSIDLFVLPSVCEGFGCVFTESWACGTPFITCEGQGMDDMILPEDRKLWLVKPRDAEDLAQKIVQYFRDRPVQRLSSEVYIQPLVDQFVKEISRLQKS